MKDWNKHQAFRDELYGIPKKGSAFYDEVFEMFYGKPAEAEAKVEAYVPYVPSLAAGLIDVGYRRRPILDLGARVETLKTEQELKDYKTRAEYEKSNSFAATNTAHQEGYGAIIKRIDEKINALKPEPKPEPKMSNVQAKAGLYTGKIITLTEEEAALYKVYNKLQRIRSKAVNKYRVYDGHPEVDKANADVKKVQTELRALIKKRVGSI